MFRNKFTNYRLLIAISLDLLLASLATFFSIWIRLGVYDHIVPVTFLISGISGTTAFLLVGVYRRPWRYTSISDLWILARGVTIGVVFLAVGLFLFNRLEDFPRSALLINWLIFMAFSGGTRLIYRSFFGVTPIYHNNGEFKVPVLLVGAGDDAEAFIRASKRTASSYKVIGMLDNKNDLNKGTIIHGIKVLGDISDTESILKQLKSSSKNPQRLVIATPNLSGEVIGDLLLIAEKEGVTIGRAANPAEVRTNKDDEQVVDIRFEDLLRRPQNRLDFASMQQLIGNKRIIITGAGGSIGRELTMRIASFKPEKLTLIDSSEYALYKINLDIEEHYPKINHSAKVTNVRDEKSLDIIFKESKPHLVFHAAAMKHVTLCEHNPCEAIKTNLSGTELIAKLSYKYNLNAMVLISTDKAVNPSSIMGASKRAAELALQVWDTKTLNKKNTRYVTVRFGNVLGSTGSVIPLFQRQLSKGGPLTVTHPDVTRFFMTINEAVDLVLMATNSAIKNKRISKGAVHVLEMGKGIKIDDLARQIIRIAGLRPKEDIQIKYTGLRKGEKMHEELFYETEKKLETKSPEILIANNSNFDKENTAKILNEIQIATNNNNVDLILKLLCMLIPNFIKN